MGARLTMANSASIVCRRLWKRRLSSAGFGLNAGRADSILSNDFNLALTGLLFATAVTLLSNLAADLAYGWLDPRIKL